MGCVLSDDGDDVETLPAVDVLETTPAEVLLVATDWVLWRRAPTKRFFHDSLDELEPELLYSSEVDALLLIFNLGFSR